MIHGKYNCFIIFIQKFTKGLLAICKVYCDEFWLIPTIVDFRNCAGRCYFSKSAAIGTLREWGLQRYFDSALSFGPIPAVARRSRRASSPAAPRCVAAMFPSLSITT